MSLEAAEQFEQNEQYDKAYEEYKKALAKRPDSIEILERAAHAAMVLEKCEDAQSYYEKILEKDATNQLAYEQLMDIVCSTDRYKYYIYRGNLHVLQGQNNHAINDFKKALDKAMDEKQQIVVRFVLAGLYEQAKKPNLAIDEYLRVIDSDEATENTYIKLAQLYEIQEAPTSAIEILERAIEKGLNVDSVKNFLAQLYLKNNQPESAAKISGDKLIQAQALIEEGKDVDAFNMITEMEADYKKNPKYLALVAKYYYHKNEYEKSLEYVEQYDKLQKNSPLTYQMRALNYEGLHDEFNEHYNWGEFSLVRNDKEVAANEFMTALTFDESDTKLLLKIANLLDDMGDNTHAIEYYERLNKFEPDNKKALERLADFRESIGDYNEALNYRHELYKLNPNNALVVKKLANDYSKTRNYAKALEMYNKYIAIAPSADDYEEIKKKIAKLESGNKNYDDASQTEDGLLGWIMSKFGK